jgi:phospholipase/carboxylesterase
MGWAWYDTPPNDRTGLARSAEKLIALLDEIVKGSPERARNTVLGGFSQGAVVTLDVGLRYRPMLGGLVAMSGYLMDEQRAFEFHDGLTPPVCLVHGLEDEVVAVERGRKARDILTARGVEVHYQEFLMGHEINPDSWAFVSGFLEERL